MKKLFLGDNNIVPVVMFHSVGAENLDWVYSYISEPCFEFESKIRHLKDGGFNFITWSELYAYMQQGLQLKTPSILLTFDDGYLDNWVNVYPILNKYDAKGTIFVSTDFVDPSEKCRFTTDDVARGLCQDSDLQISGFLNWSEMREMENSGLIDIQSHAASHTWYFKNNRVVDFWGPSAKQYPWMAWNEHVSQKSYYMRDDQYKLVRPGVPIYEYEKSLVVKRYIPSENIAAELADYVCANGGNEHFENLKWTKDLMSIHSKCAKKFESDSRFETDDERRERTYVELNQSRQIIQSNLDKKVDFICWPGGGYDQVTLDVAREVGYKSWTLGSSDRSNYRNVPGANPQYIKRIGSAINQYWRGHDIGFTNGREFYYGVKRHQGSTYYKWAGRALRLFRGLISS